jgi:succinoglycan biosynthesis protein ExoM
MPDSAPSGTDPIEMSADAPLGEHSEAKDLDTGKSATQGGADLAVCICTFRRATVRQALESVAAQVLPADVSLTIIVVDNDSGPSAKQVVDEFRSGTGLRVEYCHAPGQNISRARNAGLDAAKGRWLAFLDDDETASPNWLARMLAASSGAAAVFGPCLAVYSADTPAWVRRGDYHSTRVPDTKGPIKTGHSGNSLIDMNYVRENKLRFDIALGLTGGEDTFFFREMYQKGGILKYAPDAVIHEETGPTRMTLRWIIRRRFRAGQSYALVAQRFDTHANWKRTLAAPLKIVACLSMSVVTTPIPSRAMWWLMRAVFHSGALSYMLGANLFHEYSAS